MRLFYVAVLSAALFAIGASPASAANLTCGQTVTQSTTLDADLSCPDSGPTEPALRIGKAGITLDLGGHKITAHGRGIVNDGFNDVTVRNGTIAANHNSILFTGVKRNVLTQLTLQGLIDGLRINGGDRNWVVDNFAQGVTFGVRSNRSVVTGNETTGMEGYLTVAGDRNWVVDNSTGGGPLYASGARSYFARNHVEVDVVPARLSGLNDSRFVDNVIVSAAGIGAPTLAVLDSSRNRVRGNAMFRGSLLIESGADNVFRRNVVYGAAPRPASEWGPLPGDGFFVAEGATGTQLINNLASTNADDGFDVRAPGTVLTRNQANDNADLGIFAVPGVVDGGGNQAARNGNPAQCSGIVCH